MKHVKSQSNIDRIKKVKSYDPPKCTILLLYGTFGLLVEVLWPFKIFTFFRHPARKKLLELQMFYSSIASNINELLFSFKKLDL